ncbi:hypothetical protein HXX76_010364 [Chlamydomonas incerta]|uniref:Uncharacterized protein n=1 Tax=Chlamydomonas incerta TaxID=51695 RepID=A0A835T2B0_CHLIN|nr:hypothetical protein HXX76_010364 [Chlamydomonas incerta]|eukprot:KAG2430266.1 hypothetical protein HXX76_010364 [Chlamydomonas incerta]
MINRAKSTLPPEARGLSKPSGPKKPSPYTQEMNAPRRGPKRASASGEGHEGGHSDSTVAVNVQELDGLIYNRLQEILGMPMMRKAAAARAASGTKGTPPKPPRGRRPAWNEEWNAGAAVSPGNIDEKPVGPAGGRAASGVAGGSGSLRDRGSPLAPGSGGSTTRPRATSARDTTPTRTTSATHRTASPPPLDVQHGATGSTQRRVGSGIPAYGAGERVVLLPSPSAASPGAAMRPSSRYGAGPEAVGGHGHLDRSTVAAIAALNPTAPAAQEAAARLQHYGGAAAAMQQQEAAGPRSSTAPASASAAMGDADATFASYLGASPSASAAGRQHQQGLRAGGLGGSTASGPSSDAAAMRSLVSLSTASQGGSPALGGMGAVASSAAASSRRPPLAPRASGAVAATGAYGSPPQGSGLGAAAHGSPGRTEAGGDADEDDAYSDEEFEEYEGSDGEGGGQGHGGEDDVDNPAALLRQSMHALHGLVQMKIMQEELTRSHAGDLGAAGHRQSQASHAGRADHAADMMASMALAGADEDAAGGLGGSSLMDGLRHSDLEYLARLGGGEPGHYDPGQSGDDRAFVIEPGAPAGRTKAWGDRQPWTNEPADPTTGMDVLRQRQDKERQRMEQAQQQQQQQQAMGRQSRVGPVDGAAHLRSSGAAAAEMGPGRGGARRASASHAEDDDSVLLGETLTAGRSGAGMVGTIGAVLTEAGLIGPEPTRASADPTAASQMQAVSNALAVLASSGKINPLEAKELRSQTDALYGSLLQLHQLMSGPRGNELRSPTPSGGGLSPAGGFTPNAQSPSSSPNASQQAAVAAAAAAVAADGRSAARAAPRPVRTSDYDGGGGGGHAADRGAAASHIQLTPKNRLVAEDVAWMAGLVHSLSESLHNSKGEVELPGL